MLLPLLAHRALLEHCQGSLFPTGKHSLVPLTPHIQHRVCAPGEPRAVLAGARHLPQEHWDKTTAFTNPSGGSVPPAQGAPQGISQQSTASCSQAFSCDPSSPSHTVLLPAAPSSPEPTRICSRAWIPCSSHTRVNLKAQLGVDEMAFPALLGDTW